MSERLEYSGDPLPSGLPGFGGGTITVLPLPGFSRVVAAQKFGPVNDAPTVTPPNSEPPPGSNPENPTNEVVTPSPPPSSGSSASFNFCEECVPPQSDAYNAPLLFGVAVPSSCTDCTGVKPGSITWFDTASNGVDSGVFLYQGVGGLEGKGSSNWKLDSSSGRAVLYLDEGEITFTRGGGPNITAANGNEYKPEDLQVCENGETKTWKVLAYKPN
jgi:hypothetical protein